MQNGVQNSKRSSKNTYLRHYTFCDKSACVHYGRTGVYNDDHQSFHPILPCVSLSSCLFVTFNCAVQVSKHYNGENETFCVKCGLIADHFSSLGLMRTKSSIEAFYGPTAKIGNLELGLLRRRDLFLAIAS